MGADNAADSPLLNSRKEVSELGSYCDERSSTHASFIQMRS